MNKITLFIALFMSVSSLHAQSDNDLLAKTQIHKVVNVNGQEQFVNTVVMALDDVVQYTTDYYNNANDPLYNIRVTFAVPNHMRIIAPPSPNPNHAKTREQLDTKSWQGYPIYIRDKTVKALAPSSYSELAWVIPRLDPKQSTRMIVRAQLVERPTLPGE